MRPVGMIILLTGAGGVFGRVLVAAGVGEGFLDVMAASNLPGVLFAFLLAAVIRVAQGSATVSMVATAGLIAPLLEAGSYSTAVVAWFTIVVACGGAGLLPFH